MRTIRIFTALRHVAGRGGLSLDRAQAQRGHASTPLHATVVATGIPGAGAIAQVGVFHKGGPFAAGFAPFTQPGRILDRTRLFVASSSNFGAPLARPLEAAGSILSLDVSSGLVWCRNSSPRQSIPM